MSFLMSIFGRFGLDLGLRLGGHFRSFWRLGRPKLVPKPSSNRLNIEKVIFQKNERHRGREHDFEVQVGPRWHPRWPKTAPRRVQDRLGLVFVTVDFSLRFGIVLGAVLVPIWPPKWSPGGGSPLGKSGLWGPRWS